MDAILKVVEDIEKLPPLVSKKEGFWSKKAKVLPGLIEGTLGVPAITFLETIRARLVNPSSSVLLSDPATTQYPAPILTPENTPDLLYGVLEHSGNLWEGYFYSYVLYNALTLLSTKVPEKVRLASSVIATNAIIYLAESGKVFGNTPDLLDVPVGLVGSAAYIASHIPAKKLAAKILDQEKRS